MSLVRGRTASAGSPPPAASGLLESAPEPTITLRPRHKGGAPQTAAAASIVVVLVGLLALAPPVLGAGTTLFDVEDALSLALFACATNLLVGYGGLVSFGQGAFYGLGAYTVAIAWHDFHVLSFWPSFVAAPFVGAAVAALVGLLALRTRRLYFALLTLAITQLAYTFVESQAGTNSFTGGDNGLFGVSLPSQLQDPNGAYYFTLAIAAVGILALWKITHSPFGLTLRASRENRERAEALGVNVFRQQLLAFVLSGAFCALAGTLFVVIQDNSNAGLLNWSESGLPIFMILLGGQHVFLGPAVGALVYEWLNDFALANFSQYADLALGAILLVVVLFTPQGILGLLARGWGWLRHRRDFRHRPAPATAATATRETAP